jgi:septal ring factor EnvC (AmiA/AmiB activator)
MRKGITQEQVNAAADALVAAGDKPTVEKIRQALGTGSPNTVTRMLDVWRGSLAQRLQEVIKLPDVPPEAGQAFADVWRLAVKHAETLARERLTEERNALFAAQSDLTQERKLWEIALTEAQTNVTESTAELAQAEVQLRERQVLVDQLEAQRIDLLQQRDRLQRQLEQQRVDLDALRAERVAAQDHVRAVENRTQQQVDQMRQEIKSLQQRLEREQREHSKLVTQLSTQQDALRGAVRAAEQTAAHQTGRVAALEAALAHWQAPPPKRKVNKVVSPAKTQPEKRPRKDAIMKKEANPRGTTTRAGTPTKKPRQGRGF